MTIAISVEKEAKMRKLKKHERINMNKNTGNVRPFRSFLLSSQEIERLEDFKNRNGGRLISNDESEIILKDFLEARGMGALLYPELERDDWSGYVRVFDNGLLWMV